MSNEKWKQNIEKALSSNSAYSAMLYGGAQNSFEKLIQTGKIRNQMMKWLKNIL
jgi:hypothetical protein